MTLYLTQKIPHISPAPEEMPKLEEKDYAVFRDAIVDDLLKNKGNKVHTVQDESLVLEAIKSMTENSTRIPFVTL